MKKLFHIKFGSTNKTYLKEADVTDLEDIVDFSKNCA